ncbi:MAG: four-helix bundle copper-binding protein [Acidobacteriota bacterium]
MHHSSDMIRTHPRQSAMDIATLSACIDECFSCASSSVICADACLGEKNVESLIRCIRLCQDCADACLAAGRIISRQVEPDWSSIGVMIEACAAACRSCASECERHASHHAHCKTCAESCRRCEQACQQVLKQMPSAVGARS